MINYPPPSRRSFSLSCLSLLAVLGSLSMSAGLCAQQGEFPRDRFVFHIYVDPIYGEDSFAQLQNPLHPAPLVGDPPMGNRPLDVHPDQSVGGKPGKLQQAPYAFKTVRAAIQWMTDNADPNSAEFFTVGPRWSGLGPASTDQVEHIIIHCLPGIYGQTAGVGSGIQGNGEQFPIRLPPHVSIQGTSALDTVFYLGNSAHAFEMLLEITGGGGSTEDEPRFIDSVSFTQARGVPGTSKLGAAVIIFGAFGSGPIISNCIFHHNDVGIAIVTNPDGVQTSATIVNNTFADNEIGIWSGDGFIGTNGIISVGTPGLGIDLGIAEPLVINNVFVPSPGGSAFEGISFIDMTVIVAGSPDINLNAFAPAQANTGKLAGLFPETSVRDTTRGEATPRVDLSAYTDADGGNLFIRDILRNSGAPSFSDHDYRLAPMVSTANGQMPQPGETNPLVNAGLHEGFTPANPHIQHIGFVFGLIDQTGVFHFADKTEFTALDFDAEGYGNPRIASREGFGGAIEIDLGADEMAPLIVAGYADNTRIFSRPDVSSGLGPIADHTKIYFFDVFTQGNSYERPNFNSLIAPSLRPGGMFGLDNRWYFQITANQDPLLGINYPWTNGVSADQDPGFIPEVFDKGRRTFRSEARHTGISQVFYGALGNPDTHMETVLWITNPEEYGDQFMRNLQCDFSPHLLPDRHGIWPNLFTTGPEAAGELPPPSQPGWGLDIYAAHPWYRGATTMPAHPELSKTYDNPFLFYLHPDTPGGGTPNAITASTLNSPGTNADDPRADFTWLWAFNVPNPWAFKGVQTYSVNQWGYGGDSGTPGNMHDETIVIPGIGIDWHGIRVNMERKPSIMGPPDAFPNVQTFMQIDGVDPQMASGGSLQPGLTSVKGLINPERIMMEPDPAELAKELKRFLGRK